jgi:2-polyprenyl-6-methoxyphenol hydroxylase-like FAD-dependent oxidoreductase
VKLEPGSADGSSGDYDVVVVGASIAGCTAATFLGRQGARVALVESHGDPQFFKRMCTHAFHASAWGTFERLGILEAVENAGARRGGLNMWSRYGWISPSRAYADLHDPDAHNLNIRRETLDPMMRELAAGTDGVELTMGSTVTSLLREGRQVTGVVTRERDGSERELRAKLVVGADGRDSSVARLAGQKTKVKPNNRFCFMAYYRDTPLVTGPSSQTWFGNPDMTYAFPTDDGLTLLVCVPHKDRLAEFKADPEAAMARAYARLPEAPRVDPAKRVGKVLGKLDAPNEIRDPVGRGVALIGDAAVSADPVWGVGCGWAMQSGEWLAEEAGPALRDGDALDRALARYARRHRRAVNGHNRIFTFFSRGYRFGPPEKLAFRAAARDDVLAGRLAMFGERWIGPRQLLTPGTAGRILRANLSRGARPTGLRRHSPATSEPAVSP